MRPAPPPPTLLPAHAQTHDMPTMPHGVQKCSLRTVAFTKPSALTVCQLWPAPPLPSLLPTPDRHTPITSTLSQSAQGSPQVGHAAALPNPSHCRLSGLLYSTTALLPARV